MPLKEEDLQPIDKAILNALVREDKDTHEVLADLARSYRKVSGLHALSGERTLATMYATVADDIEVVILYLEKKEQ